MDKPAKFSILPILFSLLTIAVFSAFAQVNYTWNATNADWDSSANWIPAGVPGPLDTAIINSGTANLNRDAQVGGFNLNAGVLTGSGSLRVSGAMNWAGGRLEGSDSVIVAAGAMLAINNATDVELNGKVLHLAGNGTWSGNGKLRLRNGAVLSNAGGATFALQNNATLEMSIGGGSVRNSGVFSKAGGGAVTDLTAPFINQGTLRVLSGTLQLKGGSSASGAVFETGGGNVLVFSGGTHDLAGANFTGSGAVQFPDATVNALGGGITIAAGVSADLSGSNGKIQGNAPVTINGTFIWNRGVVGSGGTLTINGSLVLAGTFVRTLDGRSLTNNGAITWNGSGALRLQNNAVFANQAGGVFDLQTDALLDFLDPAGGIFTNAGTFTKSGGASFATVDVALANTGIVNVNSGTLKLTRGSELGGTIQVAANCVFEFVGGVHTLNNAAITGNGLVQQTSNTVNTSGAGATVSSPATFLLQGGLLEGDGPLTINGTFRWSGGTISGTGALSSNNVLSIEGSAIKILDGRTLANAGSATWAGSGELRLRNNGILLNQAGASFDVQTDAILNYLTPNGGTVQNLGGFSKSAGAGTTSINVLVVNNGTLAVNSGNIKLAKGSSSAGGSYAVAAGSLLELSGDVHNFENTVFDGSGSAQINNAVVNVSGAGLTVNPSVTLDMIQANSVMQGSGPVTINGTFTWDRGTLAGPGEFTVNGTMKLVGLNTKFLDGKNLINTGTINWIDLSGLRLTNNAAIINQAGAVFDIQTDATFQILAPGGTVNNLGTLMKSGGAGTATLNVSYTNNGVFAANSGTLRLANGGSSNGGTFNTAAGCMVEFAGGVHTLDNAAFGGSGVVQLTSNTLNIGTGGAVFVPSLTLNLAGGIFDGFGPVTVNGVLNWTGGTITGSGSFTINNLFNIGGNNTKILSGRTLANAGTAVWNGAGEFRMSNQAALLNQAGATFEIQSNATLRYTTPLGGSVNNAGAMRKTAGGGVSNIEVALNNSGVLEVQNGTLTFWRPLTNTATGVIGGMGILDVSHTVFSSQGSVNPGASPGLLTLIGNYTQLAPGKLNIELGGTAPGNGYDRLVVTDSAQIDGELNLSYANGFIPAHGDQFTVLTYAIRNGVFSAINHPGGGVFFTVDYTPAGVVLNAFRTNVAPSANDDEVSTDEDVALNINVLANDSDGDGDSLVITGFTQPQHGEAIQTGDSTLQYVPALNFFGADSFRYVVIDGYGGSDSATVRITVLPVNDPPAIINLAAAYTIPEDDTLAFGLDTLVVDPDDPFPTLNWEVNLLDNPGISDSIEVQLDPLAGIVRLIPARDFSFSGQFVRFAVCDPSGACAADTIVFNVLAVNDPPILSGLPASLTFRADSSATLNLWDFAEDVETPDSLLSFSFAVSNDSLIHDYNPLSGGLTLTALAGFSGEASLEITVTDPENASASAVILVTVMPIVGIEPLPGIELPREFALQQNYPNPFNPSTRIKFQLPAAETVTLTIYNVLGQKVRTLVNERLNAGFYEAVWNGLNDQGQAMASGLYIYRIEAGNYHMVRRMVLLK